MNLYQNATQVLSKYKAVDEVIDFRDKAVAKKADVQAQLGSPKETLKKLGWKVML